MEILAHVPSLPPHRLHRSRDKEATSSRGRPVDSVHSYSRPRDTQCKPLRSNGGWDSFVKRGRDKEVNAADILHIDQSFRYELFPRNSRSPGGTLTGGTRKFAWHRFGSTCRERNGKRTKSENFAEEQLPTPLYPMIGSCPCY